MIIYIKFLLSFLNKNGELLNIADRTEFDDFGLMFSTNHLNILNFIDLSLISVEILYSIGFSYELPISYIL